MKEGWKLKQNRKLLCVLSGFLVYLSRQTVGKMALFPILIFEGEFLHILKARLPLSIMPQASPLNRWCQRKRAGHLVFWGCQMRNVNFTKPFLIPPSTARLISSYEKGTKTWGISHQTPRKE